MFDFVHFTLSDRLLLAVLALMANAVIGGPQWLYQPIAYLHPLFISEKLIRILEEKLNRSKRSDSERRVRGILLVIFMAGLAMWLGDCISGLAFTMPYGTGLEIFCLVLFLPVRRLFDDVRHVGKLLHQHKLEESREAVRHIARRNIGRLDDHGVARAAIESLGEGFADRILSPLFWYLLLGLPGLFALQAISLMDHLLGYRSDRFAQFGWGSAKLDDLLNFIPSKLAGLIIAFAALFVPGGHGLDSWIALLRDARKMVSPNSGWPIAAMAGALNLTLGGPRSYHMTVIEDAWVGKGTAKARVIDMRRALYLYAVACFLLLLIMLVLNTSGMLH